MNEANSNKILCAPFRDFIELLHSLQLQLVNTTYATHRCSHPTNVDNLWTLNMGSKGLWRVPLRRGSQVTFTTQWA